MQCPKQRGNPKGTRIPGHSRESIRSAPALSNTREQSIGCKDFRLYRVFLLISTLQCQQQLHAMPGRMRTAAAACGGAAGFSRETGSACGNRLETLPSSPVRGVAQPGRVLALGARCRWFESSLPDHPSPLRASGGLRRAAGEGGKRAKPLERRRVPEPGAKEGGPRYVCRYGMYYVYLIKALNFQTSYIRLKKSAQST